MMSTINSQLLALLTFLVVLLLSGVQDTDPCIRGCQCKISLPTQVYMFSIRRSRLYTSVCTLHVSMSCVAYRCTDPGP